MNNKSKIIFMGTPDFATNVLKELVQRKYNVVAVVTTPDKQSGRGQKINESSVKKFAKKCGLPILQPTSLKDETFIAQIKSYNADLQVVVAFRMLPKILWSIPKGGTFNLHASLLPTYRGAAPINWAIINGEKKSGVTTFFIDQNIDTGEIILQTEVDLDKRETASTLHDKLMAVGADLVCQTIDKIEQGNVETKKQPQVETKPAPKINKETCRIDWSQGVQKVDSFVRGMSQYPTAWTILRHKEEDTPVKIYCVTPIESYHNLENGQIVVEDRKIKVATKGGYIQIDSLQMPSKKQMPAKDFLNGFKFEKGDVFV